MLAKCEPNFDRTLRRITGVLPHLSDQSHVDRSTLFPPSKTTSPAPLLLAYSRAIALQPSSAQRLKFLHHSRKLSGTIAPEEEGAHHFNTCPKFRKPPDADSFNCHHPTKSSRRGAYEPQHVRGRAVHCCAGNNATLTPYCACIHHDHPGGETVSQGYFSLRLLEILLCLLSPPISDEESPSPTRSRVGLLSGSSLRT
ncbi:uncharacterized protein ARMOST_02233 [Armillaria ostoyae]|uniref:Uncharacterized protein n=1 Tax=Armillaria ostoyae TaxID=47428 RepID=A0A284QR69_ARMOS|nr:uncharacterized protein ARMOST_02233 [Armillaria ostoyae]